MKRSKDISDELKNIAPMLSELDKKNLYQVPEGYFDDSSIKIAAMVEMDPAHEIVLPSILASVRRTNPHIVPEGYFTFFKEDIIARIHTKEVADELAYTAPLLTILDKKQLYDVPANYFAVFPMIASKLALRGEEEHNRQLEHEIGKLSLWVRKIYDILSPPRHAFAMACMTAAIVVGGVLLTHSTLTPEEKIFAQMQQIPDNELHTYMGKHRDDFDEHTLLHHINNIEFTHYFDRPENMPAHLKNGTKESSDNIGKDVID